MISSPVLARRDRSARVFLVQTRAFATPVAYSRAQMGRFLFGGGDASRAPWGAPSEAGIFDYLDGLTDGYFRVTGAVSEWAHVPTRAAGDALGAEEVARTLRAARDLHVDGRTPDALVFLYTGARATHDEGDLRDVREAVHQSGRPELWDARWDGHVDLRFVRVSCCARVARAPAPPRWLSVAAITHTITHALTRMFAPASSFARATGAASALRNRSKLRASVHNGAARFEATE